MRIAAKGGLSAELKVLRRDLHAAQPKAAGPAAAAGAQAGSA